MQTLKIAGRQKITSKKEKRTSSGRLYHLAFDNSLQANIISIVRNGKIIEANRAAWKLLGYTKKELLTKTSEDIFDTTQSSFKRMLAQRTIKGYSKAHIIGIKKNGQQVPCGITSVVFLGDHGIMKVITTITKEKQIANAIIVAQDSERSGLSKELHDNVNQLLCASRLYLDMARKDGVNKEMCLNRSSEYTLAAIEAIRKISKGLANDVIKDFGLSEAIENISTDTMEVHPVKISCIVDELIERRGDDKFKHNIFRIIQEQLTNIIKYARASVIKISLSQNKNTIILSISDNGIGFDTAKRTKGIGIKNIKSRAASFDGTADFVSQPGKGCVLTVTFHVTDALLNKSPMATATVGSRI